MKKDEKIKYFAPYIIGGQIYGLFEAKVVRVNKKTMTVQRTVGDWNYHRRIPFFFLESDNFEEIEKRKYAFGDNPIFVKK
jgi:hypothetical protein